MKPPEIVTFAKKLRNEYALSHREKDSIVVCLLREFNNVAPKTFAPHGKPVSFNRIHRVCCALARARDKRTGTEKFPLSKLEFEVNAFLNSLRTQYASPVGAILPERGANSIQECDEQ